MSPQDLVEQLRKRPFEPFRLYLSDGTAYDIHHPDLVMVGLSKALVGTPAKNEPSIFERYETISLFHITRFVPLQVNASN